MRMRQHFVQLKLDRENGIPRNEKEYQVLSTSINYTVPLGWRLSPPYSHILLCFEYFADTKIPVPWKCNIGMLNLQRNSQEQSAGSCCRWRKHTMCVGGSRNAFTRFGTARSDHQWWNEEYNYTGPSDNSYQGCRSRCKNQHHKPTNSNSLYHVERRHNLINVFASTLQKSEEHP